MSDEPFSSEYFQHLLTSLTLNSRALITELTTLAERHIDKANIIVSLIEERILKILPKYKLYSFYLMDSIVKNIGNPYNLLFARNLHKIFTESYLVVTDTITRQHLINLFKTWLTGKTVTGAEVFPHEVLMKIEQFIIKATSLNSSGQENVRITRDTLLREANYMLQYVIAMDEDLERFEEHEKKYIGQAKKDQIRLFHNIRNKLILNINSISETVMVSSKNELDKVRDQYASDLQQIRRALDDQSFQQSGLFRDIMEQKQCILEKENHRHIEINLVPKNFDPAKLLSNDEDLVFDAYVKGWGLPIVSKEEDMMVTEHHTPPKSEDVPMDDTSLAAQLGLNVTSFNFSESFLGSPKNELTHITPTQTSNSHDENGDDDDDYGYDPEQAMSDQEFSLITGESSESKDPNTFTGKSSMKRPSAPDEKVVKRVRFEV
ncbi:mRNA 3' end processing factor [Candidozyma auris]|uniref:CID domain-containing protein n=2 Tax=Candidozyma auris TaxID=498019 RepID=A0A2H0ZLX1_CANAR|nr:hypothetical protein QG37_02139 [[Candida] auris]PIS51588.1 hypothetical protein B9J08_003182 [[Candida] auris]QWW22060.1 hypothetical protein CA7LBN_000806 [[Candida] auris]